MSTPVRLAAGQLGPASYDVGENIERVRRLVDAASAVNVDVLVCPELALSPYLPLAGIAPEATEDYAHAAPYAALRTIFDAVREARMTLVLPLTRQSGTRFFNSALIVDRAGSVAAWYDKAHVPFPERAYFSAGQTGFSPAASDIGNIGVLICADRAFPEAWRSLALEGAVIVAAPYNTSIHVAHHSRGERDSVDRLREQQAVRMRGSALMNGYFVVAAGKAGVEAGTPYIGDSMIISPWGDVLACAKSDRDELVWAESDLDLVFEAQEHLALSRKRRPDLYGALTAEARADLDWTRDSEPSVSGRFG